MPSESTLAIIAEHTVQSLLRALFVLDDQAGPGPSPSLAPLLEAFVAGLLKDEAAASRAREGECLQPSVS